jgi:hypothetical protein
MPTVEDVREKNSTGRGYMSRKLTRKSTKLGPERGEGTSARILALQKWETWEGLQPVLILTDHKALEHWTNELSEYPIWTRGPKGGHSGVRFFAI